MGSLVSAADAGGSAWRCLAGLVGIRLSMARASWAMNAVYALGVPAALVAWGRGEVASVGAELRLFVGAVVLATVVVQLRHVGRRVAFDIGDGAWVLLAANGVGSGRYLAGVVLESLLLGLVPLAATAGIVLLGAVPPPAGPGWAVAYLLGVLSVAPMGILIAVSTRTVHAANMWINLLVILQLTLCPLLYPLSGVPAAIRPWVAWWPPSLVAEAMDASWRSGLPDLAALAALGLWTVGLWTLAWRRLPGAYERAASAAASAA